MKYCGKKECKLHSQPTTIAHSQHISLTPPLMHAFAFPLRHQPEPPSEPSNHNSMFTSRQIILKHAYRLTILDVGDSTNVPLGNVAVEDGCLIKRVKQRRDSGNVPHTNVTVKGPHGYITLVSTLICIVSTPYLF
jgi:hypothetical protein